LQCSVPSAPQVVARAAEVVRGVGEVHEVRRNVASKFFDHFVYTAHAMHDLGGKGNNLWDEEDGYYYDILHTDGAARSLRVRSMVGLIPLFAVETLEPEVVEKLHGFKRRMQWFIDNHPEFREHVQMVAKPGVGS